MSKRLHSLSAVWNALRYGWLGGACLLTAVMMASLVNLVDILLVFVLFPIGFIIGLGYGIAYYLVFEYEITEDTFDVTSGVLSRKHREIPYHRIQNIDVEQSFIQRLLGLSVVSLETAGGNQTEAELDFVSGEEATRLQSVIRERKRSVSGESVEEEPIDEATDREPTVLFDFQLSELLLLSVAFFRPGAAVVLLGIPAVGDVAVSILLTLARPLGGPAELTLSALSPNEILALAIVGLPLAVLVTWVVSAVYTIIAYYDFTLGRIDSDLVYERGLFSRYSGTIPLGKIQTLSLTEPLLARPLDYAGLSVETAGYSPGQSQSHESQTLIPLSQRSHTLTLARSIEPFNELEFTRSPKQARRRYAVHYFSVVVAFIIIAYVISVVYGWFFYWYIPGVFLPLAPVAAHYKWKHRGYHVGDNYIVLREGFWRRTTRIVPYYRLQTVVTEQTIFQQRLGIADLTADTASSATFLSGQATAYDIATEDAQRLHVLLRERLQRELGSQRG